MHGQSAAGAAQHDDVLNGRRFQHRFIDGFLKLDGAPAAVAAIGGDDHLGLAVVDAVHKGRGAEAAEHNGVRGTNARASQHRDRQFGNHGHVDRHAVAGLDA